MVTNNMIRMKIFLLLMVTQDILGKTPSAPLQESNLHVRLPD